MIKRKLAVLLAAVVCFSANPHITQVNAANVTEPGISVMCTHGRTTNIAAPTYITGKHTVNGEQCTITTTVTDYKTLCIQCGQVLATWTSTSTSHSIKH